MPPVAQEHGKRDTGMLTLGWGPLLVPLTVTLRHSESEIPLWTTAKEDAQDMAWHS